MTITTLTLAGNTFTSYASVAEADQRLLVDPVRYAVWGALTEDNKIRFLVAATNRLDLLAYQGAKAGGGTQENQFPRTGLTYKDGGAVTSTDVPHEVEVATILTAGSIAIKPAVADAGRSGSNVEEVQAGTARVKFFRPVPGGPLQDQSAFDLLRCFIAGADAALFGGATGNSGTSDFCNRDRNGYSQGLA